MALPQPLYNINVAQIRRLLQLAAISAANQSALWVADRARELAPVRKVFYESSGNRRRVTMSLARQNALWGGAGGAKRSTRIFAMRRRTKIQRFTAPVKGAYERVTHTYIGGHANAWQPIFGKHGFEGVGGSREIDFDQTVEEGGRTRYRLKSAESDRELTGYGRRQLQSIYHLEEQAQAARAKGRTVSPKAVETMQAKRTALSLPTRAGEAHMLGGKLRRSIVVVPAEVMGEHVWAYVRAGNDEDVDYAIYQELGTTHNPAHPFMRPALREGRRILVEQVGKAAASIYRMPKSRSETGKVDVTQRHVTNPKTAGLPAAAVKGMQRAQAAQAESVHYETLHGTDAATLQRIIESLGKE